MIMAEWYRVNRTRKCTVCHKDSWCTYNDDGSGCMRVESPVPMRNGGWWHPNDSHIARERYVPPAKSVPGNTLIDCDALLREWRRSQNGQLEPFAATLGVSQDALRALGCVWAGEHRAFAFPMVDAQRRVIGIRLRNELGDKWAVKGSRSGLFMNQNMISGTTKDQYNVCLIVEGPTDTAAAIDLGFGVVGRPACLGCEDLVVSVAKQSPRVRLIILADADEPGQRGARRLQEKLRKARIVTLPAKDLRQYVQIGGTKKLLNEILKSSI
jgi:5S rRNA maturation endonuclease (ribonuclease M5)